MPVLVMMMLGKLILQQPLSVSLLPVLLSILPVSTGARHQRGHPQYREDFHFARLQ